MTVLPFRAHCARGHDRIDFTDRHDFDVHMIVVHQQKKPYAGAPRDPRFVLRVPPEVAGIAAPGWGGGEILEPYAWKPPKRSLPIERVAERVAAGHYSWPGSPFAPPQPAGELPEDQWERIA